MESNDKINKLIQEIAKYHQPEPLEAKEVKLPTLKNTKKKKKTPLEVDIEKLKKERKELKKTIKELEEKNTELEKEIEKLKDQYHNRFDLLDFRE